MNALFDTFKLRAEAVSAEVHRFGAKTEALDFVLGVLSSEPPAVWAGGSFLDGLDLSGLAAKVPGLTFQVTREAAAAAHIGVSQLDWAIAATGTLVQDAGPVDRRLASTLPLIHIALLPTEAIQPDMAAALARIHPSQAAYISMITGPSRTADIERVLTIGVHGPARLIIVFVDGFGRNS